MILGRCWDEIQIGNRIVHVCGDVMGDSDLYIAAVQVKLFPMNLLLVNANHHLLGVPSAKTFSTNLLAVSCLTWVK